jgi:hypothetical protein
MESEQRVLLRQTKSVKLVWAPVAAARLPLNYDGLRQLGGNFKSGAVSRSNVIRHRYETDAAPAATLLDRFPARPGHDCEIKISGHFCAMRAKQGPVQPRKPARPWRPKFRHSPWPAPLDPANGFRQRRASVGTAQVGALAICSRQLESYKKCCPSRCRAIPALPSFRGFSVLANLR